MAENYQPFAHPTTDPLDTGSQRGVFHCPILGERTGSSGFTEGVGHENSCFPESIGRLEACRRALRTVILSIPNHRWRLRSPPLEIKAPYRNAEPPMARKVVSRKALRAEAEAAEAIEKAKKPAKKKKAATKKTTAKRTTKKKVAKEARMKAFWGVYTQSMKRVVLFEYADKKAADKKATELSAGGSKAPHFVQLVKEPIEE
jgi:hypothetical protein